MFVIFRGERGRGSSHGSPQFYPSRQLHRDQVLRLVHVHSSCVRKEKRCRRFTVDSSNVVLLRRHGPTHPQLARERRVGISDHLQAAKSKTCNRHNSFNLACFARYMNHPPYRLRCLQTDPHEMSAHFAASDPEETLQHLWHLDPPRFGDVDELSTLGLPILLLGDIPHLAQHLTSSVANRHVGVECAAKRTPTF